MNETVERCYLCGSVLSGELDDDHVPLKQLYGRGVRKIHNPNLFTLRTHKRCNSSYQYDEDYFVHSLAPVILGSYSGNSVIEDIKKRLNGGRRIPLGHTVLKEFDSQPGGLILPGDKVAKRFDGNRIGRVVWKIVRGLYFKEHKRVLPESTPFTWEIVSPGYPPPEMFLLIVHNSSKGDYPGVFDYKYSVFPEVNNVNLWALLLWDRLIIIVSFHDPDCACETCVQVKSAGVHQDSGSLSA